MDRGINAFEIWRRVFFSLRNYATRCWTDWSCTTSSRTAGSRPCAWRRRLLRSAYTLRRIGSRGAAAVISRADSLSWVLSGPFHSFTSVIGPNGAGKSNLMDAISFVLGVRSSSLRSSALKDLIYRSGGKSRKGKGKAANQEGDTESESDEGEQDPDEEAEEDGERKAWVIAVYVEQDKEWKFQRRCVVLPFATALSADRLALHSISTAGTSEYRLNNKSVTYKAYNDQLEKFNILVKAKNFLVFQVSAASFGYGAPTDIDTSQGDVEAVASQSPKDLAKLIDQISGSLDHKAEYDAASTALDKATEASVNQHNRRKGVNGEIKQFKEMKKEAERWKSLGQEKVSVALLSSCGHSDDSLYVRTPLCSSICSGSFFTSKRESARTFNKSRRKTKRSPSSARPIRLTTKRRKQPRRKSFELKRTSRNRKRSSKVKRKLSTTQSPNWSPSMRRWLTPLRV